MDWLIQISLGVLGGVMLYYGAEFLVKGGVSVALKFKITPLVIGLTLVAFATSAPELVVSLVSTLQGHGDVALGNATGSNICNIGLILGLSAVIAPLPVNRKLLKLDMPLLMASSLLLTLFFWMNKGVNRWQGALFFAGIIAYTVWSVIASRREGVPESDGGDEVEIKEVKKATLLALFLGIFGVDRFYLGQIVSGILKMFFICLSPILIYVWLNFNTVIPPIFFGMLFYFYGFGALVWFIADILFCRRRVQKRNYRTFMRALS